MKKTTLALITLWSVLGLGIIGLIVWGITAKSTGWFGHAGAGSYTGQMELLLDETVELNGVNRLSLDFFSDDVEIKPSEDGQLRVVQRGKNLPEFRFIQVRRDNNTVTVDAKGRNGNWFIPEMFGGVDSRSKVEIYLPADYDRELDLELGSGSVAVNTALTLSSLDVQLLSGEIALNRNIRAGDASIEVFSGRLNAGILDTGNVSIQVFSGKLNIGGLSGDAALELTSGQVNIGRMELGNSLDAEVTSGTMEIGIAGNPAISFIGERTSGRLETYFDTYYREQYDGEIFGTTGEAPYAQVNASVTSGTLRFTQVE